MIKIRVLVDREGGIATKFTGFVGNACTDEARSIARALAARGVTLDVQSYFSTSADDSPALDVRERDHH